jgi:hypothetical protein
MKTAHRLKAVSRGEQEKIKRRTRNKKWFGCFRLRAVFSPDCWTLYVCVFEACSELWQFSVSRPYSPQSPSAGCFATGNTVSLGGIWFSARESCNALFFDPSLKGGLLWKRSRKFYGSLKILGLQPWLVFCLYSCFPLLSW